MAEDKKSKKKNDLEEEEGGSSAGSQGGQIEFREFISVGENQRDDLLSPEERKRLLVVHGLAHERRVKDQKGKRDQYKALKEGKMTLQSFRQGLMANAPYKTHMLSKTAQFGSGITDSDVNAVPDQNISETNNEKRKELQLNYDLTYKPELTNQPKFTPPKLTPK